MYLSRDGDCGSGCLGSKTAPRIGIAAKSENKVEPVLAIVREHPKVEPVFLENQESPEPSNLEGEFIEEARDGISKY